MIWSIDRAATLDRSISFMLLVVFSWLIYQFTDTPSRQQWLMRAYVFGTAIVLAAMFLGVVHFAASAEGGAHRFAAKGANPNGLAFAFITSINFCLYLVTRPGTKVNGLMKAAYWVYIVLAGCGVFYTGSRSGARLVHLWYLQPGDDVRRGRMEAGRDHRALHRRDRLPGRGTRAGIPALARGRGTIGRQLQQYDALLDSFSYC